MALLSSHLPLDATTDNKMGGVAVCSTCSSVPVRDNPGAERQHSGQPAEQGLGCSSKAELADEKEVRHAGNLSSVVHQGLSEPLLSFLASVSEPKFVGPGHGASQILFPDAE